MAKRRKVVPRVRNPVDVRAGIKEEDIGFSKAAQRTPTKEEIETFQRTGRSTAQQERIRATRRADPSSRGDVQRAVDARNERRGFPSGDVPTREPAPTSEERTPPSFPVETQEVPLPTQTAVEQIQQMDSIVADPLAEQPLGQEQLGQSQVGDEINVGLTPELTQTDILNEDIVGLQAEAQNPTADLKQVAGLTAAGVGLSFGGAILLSVASLGSAIIASGGLSARAIASAASGKLTQSIGGVAINPVTAVKVSKYLARAVRTTTSPATVLGILGTGLYTSLFWAQNEKGDAMTTLTIGQGQALKNGDYESVIEIGKSIEEANNISAGVPVVGFTQAEKAKFEASVQISESYVDQALRLQAQNIQTQNKTTPKEIPKWTEKDGKFTPNFNNPYWIKENGRNVWAGR